MSETQPQSQENTKSSVAEALLKAKQLADSKRSPPKVPRFGVEAELPKNLGDYVQCPDCRAHYKFLGDEGVCRECQEKKDQKRAQMERRRAKLVEVLGGEYPLNEYRFSKCKMVSGNREAIVFGKVFDHKIHNAYFFGPAGSGKSHLAYAIAIEAYLENKITLEILTTEQLSRKVTGNNFDRKSDTIKSLVEADILVLDDLCRKKETENTIDAICEIMDYRKFAYRNGLIVTGNYGLDDLAKKLSDDRLPSRIIGMSKKNVYKIAPQNESGNIIDWRLV